MSAERALLLVCGLCMGAAAQAGDDEMPDLAFLEYLGSWEESDEEWLLHEDMQTEQVVLRRDRMQEEEESPEDEESPETDDES